MFWLNPVSRHHYRLQCCWSANFTVHSPYHLIGNEDPFPNFSHNLFSILANERNSSQAFLSFVALLHWFQRVYLSAGPMAYSLGTGQHHLKSLFCPQTFVQPLTLISKVIKKKKKYFTKRKTHNNTDHNLFRHNHNWFCWFVDARRNSARPAAYFFASLIASRVSIKRPNALAVIKA